MNGLVALVRYLFRYIFVEGPDGRRFRFSDVPGQVHVGAIADELVEQLDPSQPTASSMLVVDIVAPDGTGTRLDPDSTLNELAVADGSQLRISFERHSGVESDVAIVSADVADEGLRASGSTYLEHAVDEIFSEAGIQLDSGEPDLLLTEKRFVTPALTVVQLTAGLAAAALELHDGYWTYYWRSALRPAEFLRQVLQRGDLPSASLTVVDASGNVLELPDIESARPLLDHMSDRDDSAEWTLLRFDGPDRSWVWQRVPAALAEIRGGRSAVAYAGCASTANHAESFRRANELLALSAVSGQTLLQYVHLIEHYITRWDQVKWKAQQHSRR